MKVQAKFIHSEILAGHLVQVIEANKGYIEVDDNLASLKITTTPAQLASLIDHAVRKVLHDSGENNNALVLLAEKDYNRNLSYPYFSFLPDSKKLV